ncbi:hypothetical protein F8388_001340 [Cannabis sativa]|uniref:Uncharacterized protein n=1 Tax=Cannabis sativa TaxID=3483 RepID=A0A7J6DXZ1_CANSA|nr:hypothetical protein F8388_001340 [Cannabis sativa]
MDHRSNAELAETAMEMEMETETETETKTETQTAAQPQEVPANASSSNINQGMPVGTCSHLLASLSTRESLLRPSKRW